MSHKNICRTGSKAIAILLVLSLGFFPYLNVIAANNGFIFLSAKVIDENGELITGAAIHVKGQGSSHYSIAQSKDSENNTLNRLTEGEYKINAVLPMGYELTTITDKDGNLLAQGQINNRNTITIDLSADEQLTFQCKQTASELFHDTNNVQNNLFAARAYDLNFKAQALGSESGTGPFEIIMVLDYSGSMALGMDGNPLPGDVDNCICGRYPSCETYCKAKTNPDSRYNNMKDGVIRFVEHLVDQNSVGKIAFVMYNGNVETTEFIDLTVLAGVSDLHTELSNIMDNIMKVESFTYTDLGLEKARDLFHGSNYGEEVEDLSRNLILFTDGEPGSMGFTDYYFKKTTIINSDGQTEKVMQIKENGARAYHDNSFRIMAEAINQAEIIKSHSEVSVNSYVEALGPTEILMENPNIDADVVYRYYGASIDSREMGYPGVQSPSHNSAGFRQFYNEMEASGTLAEYWKDSNKWARYSSSTNGLREDINSGYLDPPKNAGDYSRENFASNKHGNYERKFEGTGATFYSIGLFDENTYHQGDPELSYVEEFLSRISSKGRDGQSLYAIVDEQQELMDIFDEIFENIIREDPKPAYVAYEVPSTYMAYTSKGYQIGTEEADGIWKEVINGKTYIIIGPQTMVPVTDPSAPENMYYYDKFDLVVFDHSGADLTQLPVSSFLQAARILNRLEDGSFVDITDGENKIYEAIVSIRERGCD